MAYIKVMPFLPQFEDVDGTPLELGTIEFYLWDTTTPTPYYTDWTGTSGGTSLTLNLLGQPEDDMFLDTDILSGYKFVLKDRFGNVLETLGPFFPPATYNDYADPVVTAPVFLKTVSDVINGERVSSMRWVASKAEQAAIIAGTTTTDHTTILNQMMQDMKTSKKANLYLHPGLWNSKKVIIPSNIKIWAHGATWKARSDLPTTDPMIINEVYDGTETAIEIYGGRFQGNGGVRQNSIAAMLRVDKLKIVGSEFFDNRDTGLALGGCTRSLIDDVHIHHCGRTEVTAEGGAALYIGSYGSEIGRYVRVRNPVIHDCEWHGVTVGGGAIDSAMRDVSIESPMIYDVKEAGIFGGYYNGLTIVNPLISNITRKYMSSSGIEVGGEDLRIIGGEIANVQNSGITLTDTNNAVICGVGTTNCGLDAAYYATAPHIGLLSLGTRPDPLGDIQITGHLAVDYGTPCYSAVSVVGQVGGDPCLNVSIKGNSYSNTVWGSGKAVYIDPAYWGEGCVHLDNGGADDTGSVSANRGDASVTLRVGIDEEVQRFQTNLSTNRTITLSTNAVYNGAKFRIVRSALGAGTLDVGGLKTMPAATAAWCEVTYSVTTWNLTGYGLL